MTLSSFYARLALANPNLRFRKKTPYTLFDGSRMTLVGLYRRQDYLGFCLDGTDVWKRSIPIKYRKAVNRISGEELVEVQSRRKRGREEFIRLLTGHRLINRAGRQLLRA
jgi:hypothetical protein